MATRPAIGTAGRTTGVDEHLAVRTTWTGLAGRAPPVVLAGQEEDALTGNAMGLPVGRGLLLLFKKLLIFLTFVLLKM